MKRNLFWIKWDYFFGGLWPLSPLVIVYFKAITGSYATAMAVFSVASISTLLFEVPSGVFSDFWGRKKTLFICGVLSVLCGFLWALAGTLDMTFLLFLGALCMGMSDAFLSGTDEALMYETMENLGKKDGFGSFFAEACQWNQVGLALSAFVGGFIVYFYSLQALAWVSVIPMFLGFLTICFLVEPRRTQPAKKKPIKHCWEAIRWLVKNKKLRFFSAIQVIYGATCFPIKRLEGAYFERLLPMWLVNGVSFFTQIISFVGFKIAAGIKKSKYLSWLSCAFFGNGIFYLMGLMINTVISPFIMVISQLFYGPITMIETDILQQEFSETERATLKSLLSLMEKILSSLLFVGVGLMADCFSPIMALVVIVFVRIVLGGIIFMYKKSCHF